MLTTAPFRPPTLPIPERQLPFFQALRTMLDNPMEAWPRAIYEQAVYVPPRRDFRTLYLCDPKALRTVLLDDVVHFPKSVLSQRLLTPMLGGGLLTAEFSDWRWQRRAAAPAFQERNLRTNTQVISEIANQAVARWQDGDDVEIMGAMMELTFEIILETMLGGASNVDAGEMGAQFSAYLRHLGKPGLADILGAPTNIRTALSPDGGHCIRYMREAVGRMIEQRRAAPPQDDLVAALMGAHDRVSGRGMTDEELRDNLITFLAAGHETTALALTWSLFLISQDTDAQERIAQEANAAAGGEPIGSAHVAALRYTKQVIQEAMRLYPPVPVLTRRAARACVLAGQEVRKGDIIVVPVYALHRHRAHWADPDVFDPSRFAAPQSGDRRFVYLPFGAGPRICIGASFAMSEATIVLASLVRAFRFRAHTPYVRPLLRITLRPEGGLMMRLHRRERCNTSAPPTRAEPAHAYA